MGTIWIEHGEHPGYLFPPEGGCMSIKRKPVMLKPRVKKNGYVQYYLNGKDKAAHRLIAQIYCENKSEKPCVNHVDGNKRNNSANNLEWVTHKENIRHSWKELGRNNKHRRGEKSNFSKLTMKNVCEIKKLLENKKLTHQKIATIFNVSRSTVTLIANNKIWVNN